MEWKVCQSRRDNQKRLACHLAVDTQKTAACHSLADNHGRIACRRLVDNPGAPSVPAKANKTTKMGQRVNEA